MAELRFKIIGDDTDIRKKLAKLAKIQSEMGGSMASSFEKAKMGAAPVSQILDQIAKKSKEAAKEVQSIGNASSGSGFKEAQLATQQALANSRLEVARLKEEQQKLRNEYDKGRVSQQEYRTQLAQLVLQQKQEAAAAKAARQAQQQAAGSYNEANVKARELLKTIKAAPGGFNNQTTAIKAQITEYNRLNAGLKQFDAQLGNHQREVGHYSKALSGARTQLAGLASTYLSAYAALATVNKIVRTNAEISDSLADVRRTAELTDKEANNLLETFKKFDTRTGLKELLDIAGIAGQMGIAKSELAGFTQALDKLAVVLSNEIPGGAEEVASALGKINGVFDITGKFGIDAGTAMEKTGSAILKLGQDGLATGDYLQDFTQRIGGVAQQANLTLPTILAYGSVLEESGTSAEVAGTALNRFIGSISSKRDKFYAIAKLADSNLTLEKFTKILNTDANQAMQMFFKGLNKGNPSLTTFNDRLDTIGMRAGPGKAAIIALAQNQDKLNEKIKVGVKAFDDGTLAAEQFAIKNETLGASVDKLGRSFTTLTTSGKISSFFKDIIDGLSLTLNAFEKLVNSDSWGEFWNRISRPFGSGGSGMLPDPIDLKKSFDQIKKINETNFRDKKNNSTFVYEGALKGLGQAEFNKQLEGAKKNYDEMSKAATEYEAAVLSGRVKEGDVSVAQYKIEESKARVHYLDLLKLQSEFGYKTTSIAKVINTEEEDITDAASDAKISAQRSLQAKIDELINGSKRKQLTDNEEEIEAIRDKYNKISKEISDFNKNPDNKTKKVDGSGLASSQKRETEEALASQQLEADKQLYAEKKVLFDEFEQYKLQVGVEEANKRFASELGGFKSYVEYLQSLMPDETDQSPLANKQRDYLNKSAIPAAKKDELKRQEQIYTQALLAAQTYSDKRKKIEADYQEMVQSLQENAKKNNETVSEEQLANLKKLRDKTMSELSSEELTDSDSWKMLFSNLDTLTINQIDTLIKEIESKFSDLSVNFDPIDLEAIRKKLDEAKDILVNNNPFSEVGRLIKEMFLEGSKDSTESAKNIKKNWTDLATATEASFDFVKDAIDSTDILKDAIGEVGNTAINSLMAIASTGIAVGSAVNTASEAMTALERASVILSIVRGALAVTQAISNVLGSIFNRNDKRIQKSIEGQRKAVEDLEKAYAQLDRIVNKASGSKVYEAQKQQIANLEQQRKKIEEIRRLEIDKKKTDKDKVRELDNELQNIDNSIEDLRVSISETLLGTNFRDFSNSLMDAVVSAFESGESAIDAMNDTFDDFIKNALTKSLLLNKIAPIIEGMMEEATKYAEINNGSLIGFDFDVYRRQVEATTTLGLSQLDAALAGMGIDLDKGKSGSESGLSKNFSGITETTANRLESEFGGLRLAQLSMFEQMKLQTGIMQQHSNYALQNLQTALRIEQNTFRTANNTDNLSRLTNIETAIVSLNSKIVNTDALRQGAGVR